MGLLRLHVAAAGVVAFALASSSAASTPTSSSIRFVAPDEMLGSGCASQSDCGYLPGLACVRSTCTLCDVDADCGATPSDTSKRCVVDHGTTTVTSVDGTTTTFRPNSVCMEKNLFDPFTTHDAVASLLAFLCTALGSAAGTGGGGLLVPMYILAFGLGPKHAVPMSKTTIFGGAIATLMVNVMKKHPCTSYISLTPGLLYLCESAYVLR
ncbi:hypothetical protein AaE_005767 [Aphanomyces astaci]|uniref:Membrane transporter protein n=1 Tax=Aphanomyces astaci TaxID=112090 RepID=A0A6A5ALL1_APHAT|nr:hypothetical protein AaE_005767 [Aphanomyces astaci]